MSVVEKEISKVIDGKRVIVKKPELLAPAGNLEKLKIAVVLMKQTIYVYNFCYIYSL